ncbi:MAG TPA: hypothetical protein VKA08_03905 [Balneolales bacterium]|nr:hypothetical protein [Balneolales bacterium]
MGPVLHHYTPRTSIACYFVWLLGSIGLMSATGYLLFSGISGIGDFGTTPEIHRYPNAKIRINFVMGFNLVIKEMLMERTNSIAILG